MTSIPQTMPTSCAQNTWNYEDIQRGQRTADVEDDHTGLQDARNHFKVDVVETEETNDQISANPIIAAFRSNNMVQRIVSGLLLGAAVTVYLTLGPAAAPIYLCSFVVSICNYEYSWLAHRIAYRFTVSYAHQAQEEEASSMDILPLDLNSMAASRLPFGSRHPKVVAGVTAFIVTALVTIAFIMLQTHFFHYETVSYINIYQKTVVYTWLDFILLIAISTWITIFSALLTPTPSSAINHIMQQFVYSWSILNFFTCNRYDTNCYLLMRDSGGRINAVAFILMNRVPWWRSVTHAQAIDAVLHVVLDVVGFAYISLLMTPVVLILFEVDEGARIALGFLAVVWGVDTGAYFFGKFLKHIGYTKSHFLARHISPNKDIEGSIGGIALGIAATLLVDASWSHTAGLADNPDLARQNRIQHIWRIIFAVVGGGISRYGDLFASLIKRLAGVKDTGTLIPGHGGLLDRVDAMLFLGAVFVLYHRIAFPEGYDTSISNTLFDQQDVQDRLQNGR